MDQIIKLYVKLQEGLSGVREHDENGATAVEYGLLVALIAAVIVVTVGLLGTEIHDAFTLVLTNMP